MWTVATTRCPANTACGVRWGFVVVLACLSNVAIAGFVPANSEVPFEMCSQLRRSDWLSDVLGHWLADGRIGNEAGATGESSGPAQQTPVLPQENQASLDRLAVLGNSGNSGSTGSSDAGPQTMSHSSMLLSDAMQYNPPLVSRLDISEDSRLPLKLPYKLFRPPRSWIEGLDYPAVCSKLPEMSIEVG